MGRRARRSPRREDGGGDALRRGYARGAARDERIRRSLEPLRPGQRPGAVTVAAIVAVVLAVANTAAVGLGQGVGGGSDATVSALGLSAILLVAAFFMWRAKYWAVLGFQALLALQIVICVLSLLVADDVWTAVGLILLAGLGGWLFWRLVRAMARLQMPRR